MKALLCALILFFSLSPAFAVNPEEMLKDPAAEARARKLSTGLRCLVCQNESIDDSNAPLAKDLRLLVRERITAGDSDQQVKDFLVSRYGQYVLLMPPFSAQTALLYTTPFLVLGICGILLWRRGRVKPEAVVVNGLTDDEKTRLEKLISR
jgi:cytochrome c-type biogenesis protein CcmH